MTLTKLAQLANVSVSVVSKAFSGREDVSDAMREHVFAVARAHGCFNQFYHVPYDRPVVAVIIPEVISQFYIHYMEALKAGLEAAGCTMLLSISNFAPQMRDELVRYYTAHGKVDALILLGSFGAMPPCPGDRPPVLIEIGGGVAPVIGCRISHAMPDGLREALRCLRDAGHRRIAYVGEAFIESKAARMAAIMHELGLEPDPALMICSRYRFAEAGADGVERLWQLPEAARPTAIVGGYGYITQGILAALGGRGIDVPGEVSVVSMDSDPDPLDGARQVSCIPSGIDAICAAAMAALRARLPLAGEARNAAEHVVIPGAFCRGETVGIRCARGVMCAKLPAK